MVRSMLSESMRAVILRLVEENGGGRIAAHEIMIGIPAIRNLIREDKVAQDVFSHSDRDGAWYANHGLLLKTVGFPEV